MALGGMGLIAALPALAAPKSGATPAQRARRRAWLGKAATYEAGYRRFEFDTVRRNRNRMPSPLPGASAPLPVNVAFDGEVRSAEEVLQLTSTLAFLVIKDGRIVHESYRNGAAPNLPLYSASMSKSIVSLLAGIAFGEGRFRSVDEPVTAYIPELRGTGYDGASIRAVLQMRSGLDWDDTFFVPGPARDAQHRSLMDNLQRYTDAAQRARRAHPPGTVYNYNSLDTAVIGWLVERVTSQPLTAYTTTMLWDPIGAEADAYWMLDGPRGTGREFAAGGFNAVLRDYARIGLLMLDGGRLEDSQIVPAQWVRDALTPPSGPPAPGNLYSYGYQWWLLEGTRAFTALGGLGQYIFVDPASRTVIVKASWILDQPATADRIDEAIGYDAMTQAFFRAVCEWQPDGA